MTVGDRLKELREERHLSQEGLAERAGVHRNTISDIERDQASATVRVLAKIATALEVGIHRLVSDEGVIDDPEPERAEVA